MAEQAQPKKVDMDLVLYFTEDLLRQGQTKLQVEKILVEKGMKPEVAGAVVEKVARTKFQAKGKRASNIKLIRAIGLLVVGFGSLIQAANTGEIMWIGSTFACIFFGLFGLYNWYTTLV